MKRNTFGRSGRRAQWLGLVVGLVGAAFILWAQVVEYPPFGATDGVLAKAPRSRVQRADWAGAISIAALPTPINSGMLAEEPQLMASYNPMGYGSITAGPLWTAGFPLPARKLSPTVTSKRISNVAVRNTNGTIPLSAVDHGAVASGALHANGNLPGNADAAPLGFAWGGVSVGSRAQAPAAGGALGAATTAPAALASVSATPPPAAPAVVTPANGALANGALGAASNAEQPVAGAAPNSSPPTVVYYGRPLTNSATGPDFTLVVLPDTQFYAALYPEIFQTQTDWIISNRMARNIVYVTGVGDVVDAGSDEWQYGNATNAFYRLEDPVATGLREGLPYSVPVGNHDLPYKLFNTYFGAHHFTGRSYFGGNYSTGYQNHYDLFSAGGLDFIVLALEYNAGADAAVMNWANAVLQSNVNRRAIVVTHSLLDAGYRWPTPAAWSTDGGTTTFPALTNNPNLFLMLCGHNDGQGRRHEAVGGRYVDVLLADYQCSTYGGDGYLRTLEFSPSNNVIRVKTYSPDLDASMTDGDSEFTLAYAMAPYPPFVCLGTNLAVAAGIPASPAWSSLAPGVTCEWYTTTSDGSLITVSATNSFTTVPVYNVPPVLASASQSSGLVISNATPQQGDEGFTVLWPAVPGKTYQVEYCDALGDPWKDDLPDAQMIAGSGQTILAYTDSAMPAANTRFYRIKMGASVSANTVGYAAVQVPPAGGYTLCGLNFMPGGNDPTTLLDLLGTNQLVRNNVYTEASKVLLWDAEAQEGVGAYLAVFQKANGNFYLTESPSQMVNPAISLGEAFWIQSPPSATDEQYVFLAGAVQTDATMPQFLPAGLTMIANLYATPLDVNGSNLSWAANGATAGDTDTLADQIFIWTSSGYNSLYLQAADEKWHYQRDGLLATNAIIPPGAGVWYKAQQVFTNWMVRPYSW